MTPTMDDLSVRKLLQCMTDLQFYMCCNLSLFFFFFLNKRIYIIPCEYSLLLLTTSSSVYQHLSCPGQSPGQELKQAQSAYTGLHLARVFSIIFGRTNMFTCILKVQSWINRILYLSLSKHAACARRLLYSGFKSLLKCANSTEMSNLRLSK